jgi:outer membrane biosynthesis protein TonB
MDMKLTLQRGDLPAYEITIPSATVSVADHYAQSIGLANTEHLMMRMLLDNLLVSVILPRAEYAPEVAAQIAAMEADLATKKKQLDGARISPLLPTLTVGGEPITLAQIEAALAAARAAAQNPPAPVPAPAPEPEPTPEPTPEPEPEPEPTPTPEP